MNIRTIAGSAFLATGLAAGAVFAEEGLEEPFQADFRAALEGAKVAFVPVAMGFDLTEGWFAGLSRELEPFGVEMILRDPNWDPNAGAQALTQLIAEEPDVIVVHNPDVQTYARLLRRAENAGIHIVQVNMASAVPTASFVGANWIEIGERAAQAVVDHCQNTSNKVAIVEGVPSAAASAYTLRGVDTVFSANPQIEVVSSQAANWDASTARSITQTVLQQHPDLCGIVGFWDGMDIGTAAAVKEAGLEDQIFLATSGGGEARGACAQVEAGAFDLNLSYDVPTQAAQMAGQIKWLLSSGVEAGTVKGFAYTTLIPITPENAGSPLACWNLSDLQ
ncbi:MAG: sugar ABC transporter substrate-binding protein [Pseudomonadota bacterium]